MSDSAINAQSRLEQNTLKSDTFNRCRSWNHFHKCLHTNTHAENRGHFHWTTISIHCWWQQIKIWSQNGNGWYLNTHFVKNDNRILLCITFDYCGSNFLEFWLDNTQNLKHAITSLNQLEQDIVFLFLYKTVFEWDSQLKLTAK